jgi:hypothetical protein
MSNKLTKEERETLTNADDDAVWHAACEALCIIDAQAIELASLRARFDHESEIYENTKNDLRNCLHTVTQRAERAERVVAQWVELRALLVDDPAEAARRLDTHRDQERWSREPDVDSRPYDDEPESE